MPACQPSAPIWVLGQLCVASVAAAAWQRLRCCLPSGGPPTPRVRVEGSHFFVLRFHSALHPMWPLHPSPLYCCSHFCCTPSQAQSRLFAPSPFSVFRSTLFSSLTLWVYLGAGIAVSPSLSPSFISPHYSTPCHAISLHPNLSTTALFECACMCLSLSPALPVSPSDSKPASLSVACCLCNECPAARALETALARRRVFSSPAPPSVPPKQFLFQSST